MKKLPAATSGEPICRTTLGRMFVRCLMKHGARGAAEGVLVAAAEILRRKVPDRTATTVIEASVANRQMHLHLHSMLKRRETGSSVRILEDFRRKAVAAIVKSAEREAGLTMDRRLAAAILRGFSDHDPSPRRRTRAAAHA